MLYESPCDVPGYYEHEYKEEWLAAIKSKEEWAEWKLEEFLCQDLEDQFDQLINI